MIRLAILLITLPATLWAHPGHVTEVAGHTHWIALGALGLAVAITAWAALRGGKDEDTQDRAENDDEAEAEA